MGLRRILIKLLGGYTYEEKECARNEGHVKGELYCAERIKEFIKECNSKDYNERCKFTWLYINAIITELKR